MRRKNCPMPILPIANQWYTPSRAMSLWYISVNLLIENILQKEINYFSIQLEKIPMTLTFFRATFLLIFSGKFSSLHARIKISVLFQANFARWEPWHGKFGFSYPWDKYLQIGDVLRDLAATIISLKGCLQCPRQVRNSYSSSWFYLLFRPISNR